LAAGRPVVSTLVRGVSEQLNDRMNGILVAPGDPEALARGVIKATDRLSQLAAGATESTPTWSAVAEAVVAPFE
jgi:glycosyltransferase involved in cell wall biosynthesis